MTMQNDKIIEDERSHKEALTIFRRNIPNTTNIKKDPKRIKYCQRCGRWLTHFLSSNRYKDSEILKLELENSNVNWINNKGVKFLLCDLCYKDLVYGEPAKLDITNMTMSEFKTIYKLQKKKEGKVYDYIKRYNRKI